MFNLVLLGLVQGLTEFLPVSSTAHLLFVEHYLGIPRPGLVLEAVLHLGTAVAAAVMFWPDVTRLVRALVGLTRRGPTPEAAAKAARRTAVAAAVATAVTGALGLAFAAPMERMFESVRGTAIQLLVTGAILLWHRERGRRTAGDLSATDGAALGAAQALAIVPGISRSGTTIVLGLALGLRRGEAARFSFVLAIPAILGAAAYAMKDAAYAARLGYTPWELAAGGVVAALSGAVAIGVLMAVVQRQRLVVFSLYCWLAGLVVLATTR